MKNLTTWCLGLMASLLVSCDCLQRLQGTVLDADTGKPLADVYYTRMPLNEIQKQQILEDTSAFKPLTDSTGRFSVSFMSNGFNCKPHMILYLEKPGYQFLQLEWKPRKSGQDSLCIYLNKQVYYDTK